MRPKILVLLGAYLPGFKSGGPVRTVSSMVEALASEFDFYIITLNHDSGETKPYTSVKTSEWNRVGASQVYYIPGLTFGTLQRIAAELKPDVIYFNGFFATFSVIGLLARRLGILPNVPCILATRGDLAAGALQFKSPKKCFYRALARWFGLYRNLLWQASSEREKSEMLRQLGVFGVTDADIHVAPDLGFGYRTELDPRPRKIPGEAHFVTLSRIVRMKNLPFTLRLFSVLRGRVTLDIFGPSEDQSLWQECLALIGKLPSNVTVRYLGVVEPEAVITELGKRQFFILPTLGENYGHVIIEGAAAGCPVVISDRTQWLGLQDRGVGWDLSLEDPLRWRSAIQTCIDMDDSQYSVMSAMAAEFGNSVLNNAENLHANFELFRRVVGARIRSESQVAEASK